ncbi:putative 50S ribosomal protein L21, chloroplastic [Cocos nucifera]|uniref:Putative 50S ribosomal protein L21, chloroplastic n=1 Tax=Cocos nucifera TaxID=13894 RepID=A0A8K0I4C5_COCNU|nr:putative 50S ribosomal protein L21, chloroplastic [Cocos nucifera]
MCAAALSPSSAAATLSPPSRGPTLALVNRKARPFSLSVDRSSTSPAPLLSAPPLVSPSTLFSRKWKLSAALEGSAEEPEEPSVPEPVDAQIAAAATPKAEDVFAVVMIGSRQYIVFPGRFIYTQRLKGANVNDKIGSRQYIVFPGRFIYTQRLKGANVNDKILSLLWNQSHGEPAMPECV